MNIEKNKDGEVVALSTHTGRTENGISIHGHVNDPAMWFVTCKKMNIYAAPVCSKGNNLLMVTQDAHRVLTNIQAARVREYSLIMTALEDVMQNIPEQDLNA